MPNALYQARFRAKVDAALLEAAQASALQHPGIVGDVREILVEQLLRPILPVNFDLGTGMIVDHLGNLSSQTDVVIYDRSLLPAILYGREGLGIFPIEACMYSIEVKSRVTRAEVVDFCEKERALAQLTYVQEYMHEDGRPIDPVVPTLFGFASDLTGDQSGELARCLEVRNELGVTPWRTPVFCIISRVYAYFASLNRDEGAWQEISGNAEHDEVLAWLSGVANSLPRFRNSRIGLPFGHYLMAADDQPVPEASELDG